MFKKLDWVGSFTYTPWMERPTDFAEFIFADQRFLLTFAELIFAN